MGPPIHLRRITTAAKRFIPLQTTAWQPEALTKRQLSLGLAPKHKGREKKINIHADCARSHGSMRLLPDRACQLTRKWAGLPQQCVEAASAATPGRAPVSS
jgi:hypothetical protein